MKKHTGLVVIGAVSVSLLIACGAPNTAAADLEAMNGSGISGTAALTSSDGGVLVSVNITDKTAATHPLRITRGKCGDQFENVATLNSVINGASSTQVPMTLSALLQSNAYMVNVLKSEGELKSIACGTIR